MNPLKPLPRNPTRFGVLGAASFEPGLKGKKSDEAYLAAKPPTKPIKVQDAVEDPIAEVITGPHTARPATPEERKSGKVKHNDETGEGAMFVSRPTHPEHAAVLKKHGYKARGRGSDVEKRGENGWFHEGRGHHVSYYGGATHVTHYDPMTAKRKETSHTSAKSLDRHLSSLHGVRG